MAIAIDSRQARRSGPVPSAAVVQIAERARAFRAAKRHSLLVRVLRLLLPLGAVATLLGYLGLVALNSTLLPKIKIDDIKITADDLTMKNPSYFDTTNDGRYEVRAESAIVSFGQKKETPVKLIHVSGEITKKSGEVTRLKAKYGLFDNAKGELELYDGIEVDGTNGLMARLTRAMVYSKEGRIVSTDPVSANMPTGSIQAGSMTMGTKTKLVHFRDGVSVRLVPQQGQTLGAGKDARQPVDIRAEELDIDDAAKTAHFRGKVVAIQGETMLQTPSLRIKYEGKAADALGADAQAKGTGKDGDKQGGTRVTFMWARDGVQITAGNDRSIVSDIADFDVAAETALFDGNVTATQEKNVLKGGRLSIDKKGGRSRMEMPNGGHVWANFVPPAGAVAKSPKRPNPVESAQGALMGGFKADRSAPMTVDAAVLDIIDSANKAVFTGNVTAEQGEMKLRTSQLTAFYSGKAGLALGDTDDAGGAPTTPGKGKAREKSEIVRLEARQSVIVSSPKQTATAEWGDFDVKANTALLGGGVTMDKMVPHPTDRTKEAMDVVSGQRLRLDLTTGIYSVEADAPPQALVPPKDTGNGKTAKTPPTPSTCAPGKICGLFYPGQLKQKALDAVKKKAPAADGN